MKLYGIAGKGTGKVGSMVYAISGGEQIVRQYNPIVANPNTERQVSQRSKFKLMTQLAAIMAPALAFRKQGLVSARNQFIAKNMPFVTEAEGVAQIDNEKIQLTGSNTPFVAPQYIPTSGGDIQINFEDVPTEIADRIVFNFFQVSAIGSLALVATHVVDNEQEGSTPAYTVQGLSGKCLVLAYGVKDNNAAATVKYEEAAANADLSLSTLDVARLFAAGDYTLTATVGDVLQLA